MWLDVQGASPISAPAQRSPTALRHDSSAASNGSNLVCDCLSCYYHLIVLC